MEIPHLNNNMVLKLKSFDKLDEEQNSFFIQEKDYPFRKYNSLEDFLGDDTDSTEISSMIAGIDSSYSNLEYGRHSQCDEILSILKVPHTTKNKTNKNKFNNITPFGQARRITLIGKVLTTEFEKTTPERTSNPVFKNFNTFEENHL